MALYTIYSKRVFVNRNIDNKITLKFKHFQCILQPLYITLNYGFTDCHQGNYKQGYFNILQGIKSWEMMQSLVLLMDSFFSHLVCGVHLPLSLLLLSLLRLLSIL